MGAYGFGSGFLQGFADSYAKSARQKLEDTLAQRGQLASLGLKALENARPEAQLKIITNLSRLIGADPHKKIDKDLMDIGTWLTPPEGYGQEAPTAPPPSFRTTSEILQSQGGGAGEPGMPLAGGALGPQGGVSRGTSLPVPPEAFGPPQYAMGTQETGEGPMLGMSPFNQPTPPAYSPFYSPEERAQMAAAAEAASAGARVRGEYGARRPFAEEILGPNASPEDVAAFVLDEFWPNLFAPILLMRAFAAQARRGQIVNLLDRRIASLDTSSVPYVLTKKALAEATRIAALDLAPGITVNGVAPGAILPPPGKGVKYLHDKAGPAPLKRQVMPEEIAEAVMFFLRSDSVTGQIVFVDGGQNLLGNLERG